MMRLLLGEHFRTARESLRRTRTRTALTITGIAIGVASITTILALSGGVTDIINRQVSDVGADIAVVRPSSKQASLIDIADPTPTTSYTTSPITERDVETIDSIKGVESTAPLMTISGGLSKGKERVKRGTILATTPSFDDTTDLSLDEGQFIDSVTLENTAVLGQQTAINLFGTNGAIGKTFSIRNQKFTCIGVLKRIDNPINYNNIDLDNSVIISLDSGKLFNNGVAQIQQINVKAGEKTDLTSLKSTIQAELKRNHSGEVDTDVLIGEEIAMPTSRVFGSIQLMMTFIAAISLFVGGIGIMNIMLVSVAERTREIGLRKAVGASSGSIVSQFMIEALITSLLGGIVGYALGYVAAFFISLLLPYDPIFTWQIAALAASMSVGVGILFGIYPAIRAARKDPIESLRRLR